MATTNDAAAHLLVLPAPDGATPGAATACQEPGRSQQRPAVGSGERTAPVTAFGR